MSIGICALVCVDEVRRRGSPRLRVDGRPWPESWSGFKPAMKATRLYACSLRVQRGMEDEWGEGEKPKI